MTHEETASRLESYVRRQFAVGAGDTRFSRSAALFDLGYVDSVGVVELLAFVREEFGVEIPDDDLLSDEFSTLNGIARIVCRLAGHPAREAEPAAGTEPVISRRRAP